MSKYFHAGLVLLYVLITAFAFLVLLELCGVRITDAAGFSAIAGWVLLCFAAACLSADFYLFRFSNTRQPTLSEEERLQRCFREVLQKAGHDKRFNLLVDEKLELNAFAIGSRTIAVSRGSLEKLTEGELKGLMAHELGHLLSHDSIIGATYLLSSQLPRLVKSIFTFSIRLLAGRSRIRPRNLNVLMVLVYIIRNWIFLLIFLLGLYILVSIPGATHVIIALAGVYSFGLLFTVLDYLFGFFRLIISRYIEYKQDAFAHELGYGRELQQALKLTLEAPEPVNRYFILMNSSHPVIYNRIRRLEKLEGLR